jgi:DNA-binding response OmpR family regulator
MTTAYQEVEKLLAQIRVVANNQAVIKASDQIEVICRAYMEPDGIPPLPIGMEGVHFTTSERAVLDLLVRRPGMLCRRESLWNVMPHPFAGENADIKTVDVRICKIRHKLEGTPYADSIETVWGVGFKYNPPGSKAAALAA